jgi:hypothetical protein
MNHAQSCIAFVCGVSMNKQIENWQAKIANIAAVIH